MATPEEVLEFWVDEVGPDGWYNGGDALDATIRDSFCAVWKEAQEGACGLWLTSPVGTLGYIVLTDQFPRNMFRNSPDAFATDKSARAASKVAIDREWDLRIPEPVRQFFYMPLMHSENQIDQDRCIRLLAARMPETGAAKLRHAKVHREIIRQFGRFPYRNEALGRATTDAEKAWMASGGYGAMLRAIDAAASE